MPWYRRLALVLTNEDNELDSRKCTDGTGKGGESRVTWNGENGGGRDSKDGAPALTQKEQNYRQIKKLMDEVVSRFHLIQRLESPAKRRQKIRLGGARDGGNSKGESDEDSDEEKVAEENPRSASSLNLQSL